ncbi:MAG: hypothetical protein QM773_13035, partial [Hyphomonadaceae bacterium]
MELPARIRQWAVWPGWKKHAPAAGSVAVHLVAGVVVAGFLAASGKTLPAVDEAAPRPILEVALMTDSLSLPAETVRPPSKGAAKAPPPAAGGETVPAAAPKRKDQGPAAPDAPAPTASAGAGERRAGLFAIRSAGSQGRHR